MFHRKWLKKNYSEIVNILIVCIISWSTGIPNIIYNERNARLILWESFLLLILHWLHQAFYVHCISCCNTLLPWLLLSYVKGARRCSVRDLFKQKLEIVTANLFFFSLSVIIAAAALVTLTRMMIHTRQQGVWFLYANLNMGWNLTLLQKFIGHADSFVVLL